MAQQGKKLRKVLKNVNREQAYSLTDAIKLVQKNAADAQRKFVETLEISINLGVDTKKSDQAVRGVVALPNGTGKKVIVAVFARGDKAEEAQKAGADIVGAEDLVEKITGGFSGFDRVIATPDMMGMVGKVAKILGPRGLMPNPKLGTVTPNVSDAVKAAKAGSIEFRAEKAGIVQAGIGKVNFSEKALLENARAFINAIAKARPAGLKGNYINKICLSSTMGPGLKVDISSTTEDAA